MQLIGFVLILKIPFFNLYKHIEIKCDFHIVVEKQPLVFFYAFFITENINIHNTLEYVINILGN